MNPPTIAVCYPWRKPRNKRWGERVHRCTWSRMRVIPTESRRRPARAEALCRMCWPSVESMRAVAANCLIAPPSAIRNKATPCCVRRGTAYAVMDETGGRWSTWPAQKYAEPARSSRSAPPADAASSTGTCMKRSCNACNNAPHQKPCNCDGARSNIPFAILKYAIFGHPRFLLRGLEGAGCEMALAVMVYNLKRMLNLMGSAALKTALQSA